MNEHWNNKVKYIANAAGEEIVALLDAINSSKDKFVIATSIFQRGAKDGVISVMMYDCFVFYKER